MYYLYKEEALTLKELTDICLEDKAILSKAISLLETNKLIVCDSDKKKRYNSYFRLTDKGLKIAKSIASKIDNILDYASVGINDGDREVLYRSLSLISENLDKLCEKYEEE